MFKKLMRRFEAEFIGSSKIWYPAKESVYYGRMSDAEIEAMRARTESAIKKCIKDMGDKWVLHKKHQVMRHECK
jgi:hypothetical protein